MTQYLAIFASFLKEPISSVSKKASCFFSLLHFTLQMCAGTCMTGFIIRFHIMLRSERADVIA